MRWPVLLGLGLLVPAVGCRNCDLVEAELRTKERELRHAQDELQNTRLYNQALQAELQSLRPVSVAPLSPELASQTYTLKEIVLGRPTGSYDEGGGPGDSALQVVVEPRDPDGQAIKAPGTLYIEVTQITPAGLKTPLSSWQIPPDQLRRSWRSGLLSTGYQLVLPWKVPPMYPKLRVTARFALADGRVFEADKDVTVRPPAASETKPPAVMPPAEPIPTMPEPEQPLFMPRKVETHKPAEPTRPREPAEAAKPVRPASWQRSVEVPLADTVHLLPPTRPSPLPVGE